MKYHKILISIILISCFLTGCNKAVQDKPVSNVSNITKLEIESSTNDESNNENATNTPNKIENTDLVETNKNNDYKEINLPSYYDQNLIYEIKITCTELPPIIFIDREKGEFVTDNTIYFTEGFVSTDPEEEIKNIDNSKKYDAEEFVLTNMEIIDNKTAYTFTVKNASLGVHSIRFLKAYTDDITVTTSFKEPMINLFVEYTNNNIIFDLKNMKKPNGTYSITLIKETPNGTFFNTLFEGDIEKTHYEIPYELEKDSSNKYSINVTVKYNLVNTTKEIFNNIPLN